MSRSFFCVLMDVLNDVPEIPELPNSLLRAANPPTERVKCQLDKKVCLKLARIQTLTMQEDEKTEIPDYDNAKSIADLSGKNVLEVVANSAALREDGIKRLLMLRRLFTEIVREAIPSENSLDSQYVLGFNAGVPILYRFPERPTPSSF